MKVGWKCAIMAYGVLFVMISGICMMLLLYADSWE